MGKNRGRYKRRELLIVRSCGVIINEWMRKMLRFKIRIKSKNII